MVETARKRKEEENTEPCWETPSFKIWAPVHFNIRKVSEHVSDQVWSTKIHKCNNMFQIILMVKKIVISWQTWERTMLMWTLVFCVFLKVEQFSRPAKFIQHMLMLNSDFLRVYFHLYFHFMFSCVCWAMKGLSVVNFFLSFKRKHISHATSYTEKQSLTK